jgi:hypothetical protein
VPLLIEAGSTSVEKPNAIILSGTVSDRLADAAGAGSAEAGPKQEIGTLALTPAAVQAVKQDLKANPPQQFDVARALRVFSSKVQYVEFEVTNYRFGSRQVPLPAEFLDVADANLKNQISIRIRSPAEGLGKLKVSIATADKVELLEIDEKWLSGERKRIEDAYTFSVPKFGRVILSIDRPAFDAEVQRFTANLAGYHKVVLAAVEGIKAKFEDSLVNEYLPKWLEHPPISFARKTIAFEPPHVHVVYKNITPESVRDASFLDPLQKTMQRRGVPVAVINSLFSSGDAAPAANTFDSHP